ncbi:MAG: hypothetical protein ACLUFD_08495 [Faecalibacterium sp.]|jgi:hypothetical protein|nr:MAG TPA: terminase small subunit [Caudoviricetes sp.]
MGIHRDTLNEWKSRFPDISDSLKIGRENADYIVENELFESCKTRTVTVKKPIKLKKVMVDGKKRLEEERVEYVEEQVVVPANVTAQIFYLKKRRPDKWAVVDGGKKDEFDQTVEDDPITKSLKEEFKK